MPLIELVGPETELKKLDTPTRPLLRPASFTPNSPTPTMTEINRGELDSLLGALPKYEPGGNLSVFISEVDEFTAFIDGKLTDSLAYVVRMNLKSKIQGEARDFIAHHNATTWPAIRATLLARYGDQRSEDILMTTLTQTYQKRNETYLEYYSRLSKAYNDVMQHLSLHVTDKTLLKFKRDEVDKMTLNTFLNGILEPYRSHLTHFELDNIEECLNKCRSYDNKRQEWKYFEYVRQNLPSASSPQSLKKSPTPNQNPFIPRNPPPQGQTFRPPQHFKPPQQQQPAFHPKPNPFQPRVQHPSTFRNQPEPMSVQSRVRSDQYRNTRPLFNAETAEIENYPEWEEQEVEIPEPEFYEQEHYEEDFQAEASSESKNLEINMNKIRLSKLPYLYLPQLGLKILIDSGATNSIINRKPAIEKFSAYHFRCPFIITGLRTETFSEDNITIPLFYELGIDEPIDLHVVDWHNDYDALIGSSDLQKLHANINYSTNTLIIENLEIPFNYSIPPDLLKNYKTSVYHSIHLPVTIESGDVIIPETQLGSFLIPECISTAKDGFCLIPNGSNKISDININERIKVKPLTEEIIQKPPNSQPQHLCFETILRTTHLNQQEESLILKLCKKFSDIFYHEQADLSFTNAVKHKIRTTDDSPVFVKSYRHPYAMNQEIQNHIQKLLDNKIIQPSISPYSSPVWLVPKKQDASGKKKFRLVIDYRSLNAKTVEDKYPLPRIDEILDNLGKCSYFSTLDLAQGFHQIEMDSKSIEKTAFTVNNGHYEYLRMPFGLKNAPSTFQRVMDNILREYLHQFTFVYMDDIVIFSKSLDEHLVHLRKIFDRLREFNLKIQLDKSEFLRKEVEFLGHVITPDGIKPNPSKVIAIEKFPIPKTTKEIKSFLGLIGYYRRFVPNFATIVSPMTRCLKKGNKLNTSDPDYMEAFMKCKQLLMNSPILNYPDFEKPFKLTTDASNVAIGSVLSQNEKPIAYYSRTLNSAEKNYSTIEKELLSILDSTKNFRPYLYGRKFTVETDHNPLVWLYKIKEPNSRLIRWKIKLDEYDFDVIYKKGKLNVVADALSRIEINHRDMDIDIDASSTTPQVDHADAESMRNSGTPTINQDGRMTPTVHSTQGEDGKDLPISEKPVNFFKNRIIFDIGEYSKTRVARPFGRNTYTATVTLNALEADIRRQIEKTFQPDQPYGIFFRDSRIRKPFIDIFKSLFNPSVQASICNIYCSDITDETTQESLVSEYHDATHNGITETIKHLKLKYYWPNIPDTVTKIVNKCELCLRSKYERTPYKIKFSGPLVAKRPFDVVHIDTFSFLQSKFLTIIDLFSKYAQAYYLKDGTAISMINKLRHYFSHHNKPKKIVCDEGSEFKNKVFQEFCNLHKIHLHYTTVENPSSNSPIERFHSTILEKLRILKLKSPDELPTDLMINAILIYNQSIHSSTGFSPFYLLYGPYDETPDIDFDLTIYEQYNQKRKQELLPFYDVVHSKTKDKAALTLIKKNADRIDAPDLTVSEIFVERNRPRKTDPPFAKIQIDNQDQAKITGKTSNNRPTTANLRRTKRVRK